MATVRPVLAFVFIGFLAGEVRGAQYFGKLIGKLSELHHGVSGEVYAVDSRTLYIKDFTYDGQGPAAYFYAGNNRTPGSSGFRLSDEKGSGEVIRRYRKEGVTLSLPEGKTLNNIKIFYVWCEEFAVNFGDVKIPRNFDYPRPVKIDPLQGVHAVSSDNVVVVDAQTLLIPNFSYDGEAPDAKFWVGRGSRPSPQGIRVPDENGKEIPLRRYDKKTIVINLPGDLTVFEIGHFGIWCEAFTVDFGHILIPQNLNVPPSLKMLGVSPQSKLNCEVLQDSTAFEVRWAMAGESIIVQLVAKIADGEYMSFGVSGEESGSVMIEGDVAVAYIDKETSKGDAVDYYLRDKSQCSGPTGSCPDNRFMDNTNSIQMLNAAKVNGYSIVTYKRPLRAEDEFDKPIYPNQSTPIIWAIGPLNQRKEVSFHSEYLKEDKFIHFGRTPKWNCPAPEVEQPMKVSKTTQTSDEEEAVTTPSRSRNNERRRGSNRNRGNSVPESEGSESERVASRFEHSGKRDSNKITEEHSRRNVPTPAPASKKNAWTIPPIQCHEPDDGVFYAQMGPTGGKRGYPAITGHVGWGISWYINGLLIPEINVVRGKTYTFVIEGGLDPNVPAKYHPFYITDDPVGGYEHQSAEDKKSIRIFAGAQQDKDGNVYPTGTGRLCHWTQKGDLEADDFASFGAYQRTLDLKCDQGEPGVIQWTPDDNTPDTVYYQCFTHRYLGWKINVLDTCDEQPAASEIRIVSVPIDQEVAEENLNENAETMVTSNSFSSEDVEDKVAYKISAVGDDIVAFPDKQSKMIRNELPYLNPQHFYFNRNMYQPNSFPYHQNLYAQSVNQNPYTIPYTPHKPKFQTFRPSPLIYTGIEELSTSELQGSTIIPTVIPQIISTTTSSTTTSTTTQSPTTSTISTTTAHLLEAASNNIIPNKTILISFAKNQQRQPVRSYIKVPLTTSGKNKPVRHLSAMVRPSFHHNFNSMNHQKHNVHPASFHHHAATINSNNKASFRLKTHIRPNIKPPFMMHKQRSNAQLTKQSSSVIILTPQVKLVTKSPHSLPSSSTIVKDHNSLNNIFSLKKTDTDTLVPRIGPDSSKEINALEVIYHPTKHSIEKSTENLGFHPENIKIEDGFTPIRDRSDTIIYNELDRERQSENSLNQSPAPTEHLPKLKRSTKRSEPSYFRMKVKFARDLRDVSEKHDMDEPLAEASNRQIYYLPPDNQKHPPLSSISQPSNIDIIPEESDIDIETAPDVVVTYDGKKVSGASLTAKLADSMRILNAKSLRTSEFIRTRPQSVPFKGELPPLDDLKPPELNLRAALNRNLDVPFLTETGSSSHNNPTSTKLTLVKNSSHGRTSRDVRKKRSPHHTPEHTRQQNEERLKDSCSILLPSSILIVVLVQTLLFI